MRENLLIVDNFEPEAVLTSGDVAHIRDKAGSMAAKVIAFDSITERKQMEETLRENEQRTRLKPDSILSPEGNTGNLELADIIDTPGLQALMDDFYKLAHIPMSIIDLKGRMLVGVGWQNICMKFHRAHPDACRHCIESDTQLSRGVPPGDLRLYKCKNNMWDIATPIMVGGQHVGNVFSGQFFFEGEPLDYELFRSQARRYGFDEEEYIAGRLWIRAWRFAYSSPICFQSWVIATSSLPSRWRSAIDYYMNLMRSHKLLMLPSAHSSSMSCWTAS